MRAPRCRNWYAARASAASSRWTPRSIAPRCGAPAGGWACRHASDRTNVRPTRGAGAMPSACSVWLADGKHFRAGAARLRRVALFFLDDATRYGLEVLVGTAESSALFLRGLHEVVMHHGVADLYYLDKGPGLHLQGHPGGGPGRPARLAGPRRHQVSRGPRRRRALPPHRSRSGAALPLTALPT